MASRAAILVGAAAITSILVCGCSHDANPTGHAKAIGPTPISSRSGGSAPSRNSSPTPTARPTNAATGSSDMATLCVFLGKVQRAGTAAKSPSDGLKVLKSFEPRFEAVVSSAPKADHADVQIVVTAARKALATRDLSYIATDRVAAAGARLSDVCGI